MRFLIVIFGLVFIADALGFDLTTMVAGLGITGLALALAGLKIQSPIFLGQQPFFWTGHSKLEIG